MEVLYLNSDIFISIVSILISLYVIILSLIGTSKTPISEEVLKNKLDKKIIRSLLLSTLVAVITIIVSSFLPENDSGNLINSLFIALNSSLFIYMFVILFLLCIRNMEAMAKEIDEEKKKNVQFENELKEIRILLTQINENTKHK